MAISFINYFAIVIWEIYENNKKMSKENWKVVKYGMRTAMPIITAFGVSLYCITAMILYFEA